MEIYTERVNLNECTNLIEFGERAKKALTDYGYQKEKVVIKYCSKTGKPLKYGFIDYSAWSGVITIGNHFHSNNENIEKEDIIYNILCKSKETPFVINDVCIVALNEEGEIINPKSEREIRSFRAFLINNIKAQA